ncbi:aspartic peptidase domain-containing protein [Pilobolus umbonatus]|nr:aspartic peptidase domain-containing protein [Pilobolus umbonatus]
MKFLLTTLLSMAITMVTIEATYIDDPDFQVPEIVAFDCDNDFGNWVLDVDIGYPAQTVPMRIDLTRRESWVATTQCRKEFCRAQKPFLYDTSVSTTGVKLAERVKLSFGNRQRIKGDLYRDEFSLGGNVTSETIEYLAAYDVCKIPIQNFAGSIGFNPDFTGSEQNSTNTLQKRYTKVSGNGMAKRGRTSYGKRDNDKQCLLTFGIDPSLFKGDLLWLPIPTSDFGSTPYWKTPLSCLKIDGVTDLKFKKAVAEFVTTERNIKLPRKYFDRFVEDVEGVYDEYTDTLQLECCKAKDLTFSFSGYDVTLPSGAWAIPQSGKTCTALISPTESRVPRNHIQLGTVVLQNYFTYYSTFRNSIGLALLTDDTESKIVPE